MNKRKFDVAFRRIEKQEKPKTVRRRKSIPNSQRAVCSGLIATIYNGRRIVRFYTSGQPLEGKLQ